MNVVNLHCLRLTVITLALLAGMQSAALASTELLLRGDVWRYLDNGTNQGTAWQAPAFSDISWATGEASFGYGDDDETTLVSYGPNANTKYITTYFRNTFNVPNPALYTQLRVRVIRDDGVVVYINGVEVVRDNLPTGSISYTTLAPTSIGNVAEDLFVDFTVNAAVLVAGTNSIAVEMHQNAANSSDLSFDLQLFGTNDSVVIPRGAVWKYLDTGVDQGTAWRAIGFPDGGWASGAAELGGGDGDETTVINIGPSGARFPTLYFRKAFNIANPASIFALNFSILRDDGAIVYLNGTEVYRTNMPAGTVTYSTYASSAPNDETTFYPSAISPALLVSGTNTIAVEVHQANATSSDISFNFEMFASTDLEAVRGPYLQTMSSSGVTIMWRTNGLTESVVRYGATPVSLTQTVTEAGTRTNHEVEITGLAAATKYYYSVGSASTTIAGGDANHYYVTSPTIGTVTPTRIWVVGDSGTNDDNEIAVKEAALGEVTTSGDDFDLWLMLGDNAYDDGKDSEFQQSVFEIFPEILRNRTLWPCIGNHDGRSSDSVSQTGVYFDIFSLPKNGEAGGMTSGSEAYYSFDYADIHFICLDSFESPRQQTDPMLQWAVQDAASTNQRWIICFFHHPPYTKGSHNSDTEVELIDMREEALPILEAAGVDVVLSGHSHCYERTWLVNGAYDTPTTAAGHILDLGDGSLTGDGAYEKPAGLLPNEGAVYVVAGAGGQKDTTNFGMNHVLMYKSLVMLGSMFIDVDDDQLDAFYLDDNGVRQDSFTIIKQQGAGVSYKVWSSY